MFATKRRRFPNEAKTPSDLRSDGGLSTMIRTFNILPLYSIASFDTCQIGDAPFVKCYEEILTIRQKVVGMGLLGAYVFSHSPVCDSDASMRVAKSATQPTVGCVASPCKFR
jgi:hypothetical protein